MQRQGIQHYKHANNLGQCQEVTGWRQVRIAELVYNKKERQGMLNPSCYEQAICNIQIEAIALQINPRIKSFLNSFQKIFLSHISLNRIDPIYSQSIAAEFDKLTYPKTEISGPICCNKITYQYYRCFTCELTDRKSNRPAFICQKCFIKGGHTRHIFRFFRGLSPKSNMIYQFQVCSCGNQNLLDKKFFCSEHSGESSSSIQTNVDDNVQSQFVKEMQFFVYLFFRLVAVKTGDYDQTTKKGIFAENILMKIGDFCNNSYPNQKIFASFLKSTYLFDYPGVCQFQRGKSMLNLIFRSSTYPAFFEGLCLNTLCLIYGVKNIREIVLIQLFEYISSQSCCPRTKKAILFLAKIFLKASAEIISLVKSNRIKALQMNYSLSDISKKYGALSMFFWVYQLIACRPNGGQALLLLLQKTNVTQLCVFSTAKQELANHDLVQQLQVQYITFLLSLMKIVINSADKKRFMEKIIRQTYAGIKQTTEILSLSVHRTFAFAMFAYLQFSLDNLSTCQQSQLLELCQEQDRQQLIANIYSLITKYLNTSKIDHIQYKLKVMQIMEQAGRSIIITSLEHIYARILFKLLIRLKAPEQRTLDLIHSFIATRQKIMSKIYKFYEEDEMSMAEQTINVLLNQMIAMVRNLLFLSETSFSELIMRQCIGQSSEQEVLDICRLSVYNLIQKKPMQHKAKIETYVRSHPKLIEQFFKAEYSNYKQKISYGFIPNTFNLSFNSPFNSPYTLTENYQQMQALCKVKFNQERITQLSSLLLTEDTVRYVLKIFSWFINAYENSFSQQGRNISYKTIVSIFETLVALYIETRNSQIKMLVIAFQHKMDSGLGLKNKKLTEIIQIFQNTLKLKDIPSEPNCNKQLKEQMLERKKKIEEKKKRLKEKQSQVLQKVTVQKLNDQGQKELQTNQMCIICKSSQDWSNLFYCGYFRYSNLMSSGLQQQNYPIMLITTCQHLIHKQCYFQIDQAQYAFNCEVCKSKTNILIPANRHPLPHQASQYFKAIKNEAEKLAQEIFKEKQEKQKFTQLRSFSSKLIASMTYQIFGYSLHFANYLLQKIASIIKLNLSNFKHLKIQNEVLKQLQAHFLKSQLHFTAFQLTYTTLLCIIKDETEYKELFIKETYRIRNSKLDQEQKFAKIQHLNIIEMFYDLLANKNNNFLNYVQKLKGKNLNSKAILCYNLPASLQELNREAGVCPKCQKPRSKIMICLICWQKCCLDCQQELELHTTEHLGLNAYINTSTGQCFYIVKGLISSEYLYLDCLGNEITSANIYPQQGKYLLSEGKRGQLRDSILNDTIPAKVRSNENSQDFSSSESSEQLRSECQAQ